MGFVEQEDQLRLVEVADLGQALEQLRQHPQQEAGVEPRRIHQLLGGQDVDIATTIGRNAQEVLKVESGLAEEVVGALLLQHQQPALDDADGLRGDVAVFAAQLGGALAHLGNDLAQVLEIEERHFGIAVGPLVLGPAERDVQHAFLRLGQFEQARQQYGPHFLDGRADRMAVDAVDVPERGWERGVRIALQTHVGSPLHKVRLRLALHGDTGKIALNVGREDWNAGGREPLGQNLQGHRLAGAGCPRDQAMAVGQPQLDHFWPGFAEAKQNRAVLGVLTPIAGLGFEAGVGGVGGRAHARWAPVRQAAGSDPDRGRA